MYSDTLKFNITLPKHLNINMHKLDRWLNEILLIHLDTDNSKAVFKENDKLFNRLGLIIQKFLQIGGIPVFLPVEFLRSSEPLHTTLILQKIDHIPISLYQSTIDSSISLIVWLLDKKINTDNIQTFHKFCQDVIIVPLRDWTKPGKSLIPLLQVAYQLDIPFIHLGMGVYQLGWGCKAKKLHRTSTNNDSALGASFSGNKLHTASLLAEAGLPSPKHTTASSLKQVKSVLTKLHYPLVVKPNDSARGEGVTVNIFDENRLLSATMHALENSESKIILIEDQVDGVCHRLFIQDKKLLYAVKRLPRHVVGNGIDSIRTLIIKNNEKEILKPYWERNPIIPIDELASSAVKYYGYSLDSIPDKDKTIPIRCIESTQWGGEVEDVTNTIHKANLEIAIKATSLFDLEVCGIDIISTDITVPWYQNGAIIIEVNYMPMLGASQLSRSYMPSFIKSFIDGDGKIPIAYAKNLQEAYHLQSKMRNNELHYYIISDYVTLTPSRDEIIMPFNNLKQRFNALVLDVMVEGIVIINEEA